ncbi:unannotated protein [freshwater metagenome]|uniref:Unannotated protein n=1 Tax=freshwater metagenome TaxID=449393 RepID=A0A6J7SC26_9ZZZZ
MLDMTPTISASPVDGAHHLRVLLVDDDEFARTIVGESLGLGMTVQTASTVAEAIGMIDEFDPHAVVTDLDFGRGPDGVELLLHLEEDYPWVGKVVLTAHASEGLAMGRGDRIPAGTVYLVKNDLESLADLSRAVESSIRNPFAVTTPPPSEGTDARIPVSAAQGETLRMLAEGMSNHAIARVRGISLRSAESLVTRIFLTLGITPDPDINSRVVAVRLWQQGRVYIK